MKNKRAISPVISTVLLILIVIVLALIIFLWARGFVKEAVLKEIAGNEKIVEQYCSEVRLEPIVNADKSFGFKNIGNVPIYRFELKLVDKGDGSSEIYEVSNKEGGMVNPGSRTVISDINGKNYDDYEEIKVIPILLGKSKSGGTEEFRCSESQAIQI